jgi:RNA polymerase sigma-70 factor (ECF subfamily)
MSAHEPDTDELLRGAGSGDRWAQERLLQRHRDRLRQMVKIRIDPRLAARVDPSDVVQEALAEAARKLPAYLRHQSIPFYPWLRQIAWEQLSYAHERHLHAQKRTVAREERWSLPDQSVVQLANQLVASGTSPSRHVLRKELEQQVRAALNELPPKDREVLVLWYLEELSAAEIAVVSGITESGVKSRHRRALERLAPILRKRALESM